MAFGTPGGDQQDQWSLLLFLHHADHGMNLQEAIDCPAFHSEHFPSSFWPRGRKPGRVVVEGQMPAATVEALSGRGHDVQVGEDRSEEHTSELPSLMRISYAVFCLKNKTYNNRVTNATCPLCLPIALQTNTI